MGDKSALSQQIGRGAFFVFSGRSGQVIRTHIGVGAFTRFGADIRAECDLDGDGTRDLVIGDPAQLLTGPATPRVQAYSGRTGALLFEIVSQPATVSFGTALAVGDFSGDGTPDVAVGLPFTNAPYLQSGALEMYTR